MFWNKKSHDDHHKEGDGSGAGMPTGKEQAVPAGHFKSMAPLPLGRWTAPNTRRAVVYRENKSSDEWVDSYVIVDDFPAPIDYVNSKQHVYGRAYPFDIGKGVMWEAISYVGCGRMNPISHGTDESLDSIKAMVESAVVEMLNEQARQDDGA